MLGSGVWCAGSGDGGVECVTWPEDSTLRVRGLICFEDAGLQRHSASAFEKAGESKTWRFRIASNEISCLGNADDEVYIASWEQAELLSKSW